MKNKIIIILSLIVLASCTSKKMIIISDKSGSSVKPSSTPTVKAKLILPTIDPDKKIVPVEDPNSIEINKELHIKEKFFLTQINDIYVNYEDYKNTLISVEGMFSVFKSVDGESEANAVYRNGPGCCGNDGWGGFLLKNYDKEYPKENDWIKVTGTAEIVENKNGFKDLYLNVRSIEVLSERGAEYVDD